MISKRHRLFVEAYAGNIEDAMLQAGYAGSTQYLRVQGEKLLKLPLIQEAIRVRSAYTAKTTKVVADREELQSFWTQIFRNEDPHAKTEVDSNGVPLPTVANIPLAMRLKASEDLAKSEGLFIDKVDMTTTLTLSDEIMKSYKSNAIEDDLSVDAIEAEYWRAKEEGTLPELEFDDEPEVPESLEDLI